MPGIDRDDTGQYETTYPPELFLRALVDADGSDGTKALADAVGCHRETTRVKLTDMADVGTVRKETIGRTHIWHITDEGREQLEETND